MDRSFGKKRHPEDNSGVVDYSINLDFRTPETVGNVPARRKRCKVKSTPAVQTVAAEQSQHTAGFVFPARPKLSHLNSKFGIRLHVFRTAHVSNIPTLS
jgi:hypothetical protein